MNVIWGLRLLHDLKEVNYRLYALLRLPDYLVQGCSSSCSPRSQRNPRVSDGIPLTTLWSWYNITPLNLAASDSALNPKAVRKNLSIFSEPFQIPGSGINHFQEMLISLSEQLLGSPYAKSTTGFGLKLFYGFSRTTLINSWRLMRIFRPLLSISEVVWPVESSWHFAWLSNRKEIWPAITWAH